MGRKKIDREAEATARRIEAALRKPEFVQAWDALLAKCERRADPESLFEREAAWSAEQRRVVYSGSYYDLRELCDGFSLSWPADGIYLMRLARMLVAGAAAAPEGECPSARDWQFFRQAKKGLGLPRQTDWGLADMRTDHLRPRVLSLGLPMTVIASKAGVTERTVQDAVKRCWAYLAAAQGVNLNEICDLADLDRADVWLLVFAAAGRQAGQTKDEK